MLERPKEYKVSALTFNIGCMPIIFWYQINGKTHRPNRERAEAIATALNQWNTNPPPHMEAPDIVCLQEAWDGLIGNVRGQLIEKLSASYPYNSGDLGVKKYNPFIAGSGLLIFSKYRILEQHYYIYPNVMHWGDEHLLINKGFIAVKVALDDNYFLTVLTTHVSAEDPVLNEAAQSQVATRSWRRGEQFGKIFDFMQTQSDKPPASHPQMRYAGTIVCGDFNTTLNQAYMLEGKSTGMGNNPYRAGQIKYPGRFLFSTLVTHTPIENFQEVRVMPQKKGDDKPVDPTLLAAAKKNNAFTGSWIPNEYMMKNLRDGTPLTRQETSGRIIDYIFAAKTTCAPEDIRLRLAALNELTDYPYSMSDHLALHGTFRLRPQPAEVKPSPPVPSKGI